jgi:Calcineurin-like phosphoesterase
LIKNLKENNQPIIYDSHFIYNYLQYNTKHIIIFLIFISVINLQSSYSQQLTNKGFNVISSSDFGCSPDANNNIKMIIEKNPDLFLVPGDLSYKTDGNCWFNEDNPLDSITKIAIGNHDSSEEESQTLEQQYENHYKLKNPFYSFNIKNLHVLVMDTQLKPTKNDAQYKFVINDLKTSSTDSKLDWIIVMLHKPLYTSTSKHAPELEFRSLYHTIFDNYGVDLVIQGHNHIYERTYPIKYNPSSITNPIISLGTNSQDLQKDYIFKNTYPIFVTVGEGGKSHYEILDHPQYIAKQDNTHFGFLNIDVTNEQLKLTFYGIESNDQLKPLDKFIVQKSV